MILPLITGGGAATGKPSAATSGVPWKRSMAGTSTYGPSRPIGLSEKTELVLCTVSATVTAAAAGSLIVKLWWHFEQGDKWHPWDITGPNRAIISTDSNRGRLNNGQPIAEIDAADEFIRYSEWVRPPLEGDRFFAEILTPSNLVANSVDVILHARGDR